MVKLHHIRGDINPADILSKHWGYQAVWPMLHACLFWEGDTGKLLEREAPEAQRKGSVTNSVGGTGVNSSPKTEGEESRESQDN